MAFALISLAVFAALVFATRAQATELVYWDNYEANPDNVAFANIDGSGGGLLNLTGGQLVGPEGMAYDTVTNRLFVANEAGTTGQILAINLDESGAAPFTAPGAPVEEPEGVALDPATRTIYWLNTEGDSIAWANLDGTAGGVLNTTGADLEEACCRIAIDPVGGRIYWVDEGPNPNTIGFANLNNTGGVGTLNLAGSTVAPSDSGLAVDSAGGRIYFVGGVGSNEVGYANLNGTGGGDVATTGAIINEPWGIAFDPSLGRLYTGNYNNGEVRTGAIGIVNLAGTGGGISPQTAPVKSPQDPVILKSPSGAGAPVVTRAKDLRSSLSCSTGSWAADYPGGFVYQAPRTFAYQWTRNGVAVAGAIAPTFAAQSPGSYGCTVSATNQVGAAAQISAAVNVKAAKVKLTTKRKAHANPGHTVTFKVKAVNQGDLKSKSAKVCVKLPKSAKGALKASKCKSLGKLKGRGKKSATLKIKVLPSAGGTYKVTFQVKGSAGKAAKSKIIVG
jgi:hypothetical protein